MPSDALAARLHRHGSPPVVEAVAVPDPAPDEVVVDLAFSGVNPVDRYAVAGRVDPDTPLPRTLGREGSGTLDGRPVVVFGHGVGRTRDGVWATAAVVPRAALVEVPPQVDLAQAATLGVAGVTAWRTVTELAAVTPDDRVLVLAATGGVGSMIVSLVRAHGAVVWGQTGDPAKAAWLEGHGADRAVVADAGDLAAQVAGLRPTVVFDSLGGGFTAAAVEALEPRGRLVLFGTSADPSGELPLQVLYRKGLTLYGYGGLGEPEEHLADALRAALAAVAAGRLTVAVDRTVPLADVAGALDLLGQRSRRGKLVLDLRA